MHVFMHGIYIILFLFKFYLHVADALVRRGTPGLEAAEAPASRVSVTGW